MSKIKLIFMDVDGTLMSSDKTLTQKTKEALLKAQDLGIRLVLASGRPTSGLLGLAKELEMDKHHGYFISYNGSKVIDVQTNETLFNQAMTIEEGKMVLEHMKKFEVYPMIDKDEYMYVNNVYAKPIHLNGREIDIVQYEARGGNFLLCEKEDLADFCHWEINKILTAGEPEYLQAHFEEMREPFKDTLSCMFTAPFFYEFTAKGIDKAKAIETAFLPLGYTKEEMIAFGDGHNDASMVAYVGIGIAMANAVDDLKAIADDITLSNDEDGIAESLYKYIPELGK